MRGPPAIDEKRLLAQKPGSGHAPGPAFLHLFERGLEGNDQAA
jgi:hypothetical protein